MGKSGKGKTPGLGEYRAKRSADRTLEPFAAGPKGHARLFVVQMHAARNLHYDLRLETGGVLKSWAVPKGPSFDPQIKRLAVNVEDHPVEYAAFEGTIPEGNYGAGAVIVWDRGVWVPLEDLQHGWEKGKLLFELRGYKLKGVWTLFKTKGGDADNQWLLVKKPDAYAGPDADEAVPPESILSGMTVEQLKKGDDPAKKLRARLKKAGADPGHVAPDTLDLMLAKTRDGAFSDPKWLFEVKYDGFRMVAARRDGEPYLRWRRGQETTAGFPEIATAVGAMPYDDLVLDGEIVVLDDDGKPSFQRLQQRFQLTRAPDIRRASVHLPATYFAFDLLGVEGYDLRGLPLIERKKLLKGLIPPVGPVRYSDHFLERGEEVFEQIEAMGLEGIMAKKAGSPYRGIRSDDWLKIRSDRTGDFAIVGYSPPKRARSGFGALHLAFCEDGKFIYAGRVGTGFSEKQLKELQKELDGLRRDGPAVEGNLPKSEGHVWVEPEMVAEVRYKQWTGAGQLRHPVFLRLRDDKPIEECERPGKEVDVPPLDLEIAEPPPEERTVRFTNLDKVFWPEEGYTKGDLIEYYRSVSDWLLPYLEDRPVVLTRYPDGIHGKSFFQKDAPAFVPEWVRIETMWSEHAEREIRYFIAENVETLVLLANLGTIPLHIWSSRFSTLQKPDWCILDLDPKDAPFSDVVKVALAAKKLCHEIGFPCFFKTSGSTGLHVLLPLGRQATYEQSRNLGAILARVLVMELPEIATTTRQVRARGGKVYIDYLQNGHGRLLVSPFCVRPLPGATVSTPIRENEVNSKLDIGKFTIKTVPKRLRRLKEDPLRGVLTATPDLGDILANLHDRL